MYFFDKIIFGNDDIIVDCGANIGEIYNSIKLFNNNNFYYYGFEPVQSEFELVQLNTINQILRPLALFDKNGHTRLYVHKAGADSTLLPDGRYDDGGMIESIRLDSLKQLNGKKIKLLKLEAEGAELEVLIGCGDILRNIEYISADIGFELDQGKRSNQAEVTEYLVKNNFYKASSNSRYVSLFKNNNF
jgi:FkbM family methyltransferase